MGAPASSRLGRDHAQGEDNSFLVLTQPIVICSFGADRNREIGRKTSSIVLAIGCFVILWMFVAGFSHLEVSQLIVDSFLCVAMEILHWASLCYSC